MPNNFPAPGCAVQALELLELLLWKIQSIPVDVFVARLPADGRLFADGTAASPLHDPLEDAHVFAKAGPEKFAVLPLAEPVHVENASRLAQCALHIDPVAEIVAHVITAEWQHGHGIASNFPEGSGGSRSHLRAHRGAYVNTLRSS